MSPFDTNVVAEPREAEKPVPGVNDNAFLTVLDAFDTVEVPSDTAWPPARPKAQLLVSPDRGYGKSHLIGRLFQALRYRSNFVYLRPFEEANRPWHSILVTTMHELARPPGGGVASERNPAELTIFMTHVLAHLTADVLDSGRVPDLTDASEVATKLREDPLRLRTNAGIPYDLLSWLPQVLEHFMPIWMEQIAERGIDLDGRDHGWLVAAMVLASRSPDPARKQAVLRWIRGEILDGAEEAAGGFRPGDLDARPEDDPAAVNRVSKRRLQHLCRLATLHQPFVFCFDQTEYYAGDEYLARTLGDVVEALHAEFPRQLTIVTTNSDHWRTAILPHLAPPHRDRFSFPIALRGLKPDQARVLIGNRLTRFAASQDMRARFEEDSWWNQLFGGLPERSPREVLMRAAEYWRELQQVDGPVGEAADFQTCMEQYARDYLTKPSLVRYNEDALIWAITRVAGQYGDSSGAIAGDCRYFRHFWRHGEEVIGFCLERSDNARRWSGIVREAKALRGRARPLNVRCVALRSGEQEALPKSTWNAVAEEWKLAEEAGFRIEILDRELMLALLCGREMYSDAVQGNLEGWTPKAVLAEMHEALTPWIDRIWSAAPPPRQANDSGFAPGLEAAGELRRDLVQLVRDRRRLPLEEAQDLLRADADWICASVEGDPHIRMLPDGESMVLQWEHAGL